MSKELLKELEPKIGNEAATLGVKSRFNLVILSGIALGGVVLLSMIPTEFYWPVFGVIAFLTLVMLIIAVRVKIQMANLISQRLNTKVSWYSVPNILPVKTFDRWLGDVNRKETK